ncbi:MAG: hypothetical protein CYG59_06940 [Chloroflexi bacterium]|nr:MAG: hypothetical protein CYG59_06940 [Chloroflexota bacterium]
MLQNTTVPLALVVSGLACLILAIVSEIPPQEGELRLLAPKKYVPITGIALLVVGVPLLTRWPIG